MTQLKTSSGQVVTATKGDGMYEQYIKGGATEIPEAATPTTPTNTPTPAQSSQNQVIPPVSTDDIVANTTNIESIANKRQRDILGIQNALKDKSVYNKVATAGFINAAFNAKYGRDANVGELGAKSEQNPYGLQGATVKDIIGRLGLDQYLQDYGMGGVEDPIQTSATGEAGSNDNKGGSQGSTGNQIQDQLNDWYKQDSDIYNSLLTDRKNLDADVAAKSQYANTLKGELDQLKNSLDYDKILQTAGTAELKSEYYSDKERIENQNIPMGFINGQLTKLYSDVSIKLDKKSIAEAVTNATNTYRYNSKLIEYNVALGDLQSAQTLAQNTAQDIKDYRTEMLNIMGMQNQISMQDRQLKQDEIDREFDLAEKGYVYVDSPDSLNQLAIDKGLDWVKQNTLKLGEKIYIKPEKVKEVDAPITQTVSGTLLQYNPSTGKWDTIYSSPNQNGGKIVKINGTDYVQNPDGSYSLPDIQAGLNIIPKDVLDKAQTVYDNVVALQETDWGSIVGSIQGEINNSKLLNSDQEAALTQFDKLSASLTLENMGVMKGVLSDADIAIIKNASTALRRTTSEETFNNELLKIKRAAKSIEMSQYLNPGQTVDNSDGSYSYMNLNGTVHTGAYGDNYEDTTLPKLDFNIDDTGTDTLNAISKVDIDSQGGQCGSFVNKYTGLGLGDSFESKMSKMNPNINYPEPGMVFTMPYKDTGHTGFIVGLNGDKAIVKDSNWKLNEKVLIHEIPISVITGLTYA